MGKEIGMGIIIAIEVGLIGIRIRMGIKIKMRIEIRMEIKIKYWNGDKMGINIKIE